MFSFFQTIFHKVTTVIAAAAIAIGFISAPEPSKQSVLNNQIPIVVEQQVKEREPQAQKKQPEANISTETEKLKKEIENLRKNISQQNQSPVVIIQPIQQPSQPSIQKTVPPRPENSDDWIFNWNIWAWEKHPSAPPVAPTVTSSNPNQSQVVINQFNNSQTTNIQSTPKPPINSDLKFLIPEPSYFPPKQMWRLIAEGESFVVKSMTIYKIWDSEPVGNPGGVTLESLRGISRNSRELYFRICGSLAFLNPLVLEEESLSLTNTPCAEKTGYILGIMKNNSLQINSGESFFIVAPQGYYLTFLRAVGLESGKEVIIQ